MRYIKYFIYYIVKFYIIIILFKYTLKINKKNGANLSQNQKI